MVGDTLRDIRDHLRTLADPAGRYYLVCARTGERPFPADCHRFPDRETAVEAATAADAYRDELRQWDRRLPIRDFVVCEDPYLPPSASRTDFCHEVAGAVFETLSDRGHDDIEDTVIDAYLAAAERVPDRDRLCLLLLECLAERVATLSPTERLAVLRETADRLSVLPSSVDPVADTLDRFVSLGLLESYECRTDGDGWRVRLDGYELDKNEGLSTLPFAVEYLRRAPGATPTIHSVDSGENGGWRFEVIAGADDPDGLVRVVAE
jgi:hypothetical protein